MILTSLAEFQSLLRELHYESHYFGYNRTFLEDNFMFDDFVDDAPFSMNDDVYSEQAESWSDNTVGYCQT